MASADEGYEDDVPRDFRCAICLNILKLPMQCARNEHSFWKSCIHRYLQEFERCPSCMEPLTLQTLRPSRVITDLVSQLKIKCDNVQRGCPDIVKLENVEGHVANCEFSPVKCSNESCEVIFNRRDQAKHENNECGFRKGKCEVCGKNVAYEKRKLHCYVTKIEMNEMKNEISDIKEIVLNMSSEMTGHMVHIKDEMNKMKDEMNQMKDQMNEEMNQMKDQIGHITRQVTGMKCKIDKIKKKVQSMEQESQSSIRSLGPPVACSGHNTNDRSDVIIAGGASSRSVEMFSWTTRQWTLLLPMMSVRWYSSSFLHQDRMFVCGGKWSDTMETFEFKEEGANWEKAQAKLPQKIWKHASIVNEENLLLFGGESSDKVVDNIYKVSIVSPDSSQAVCHLPEPRCDHGAQRFGNQVAIVGGTTSGGSIDSLDSVLLYDITRNCCRTLAPLPFAVCAMATVALGDNIIIIGGLDKNGDVLNSVVSYNVKEQKSKMLPSMKQKRELCTAVVTDNVIVVMGGLNEEGDLNSVECFNICTYMWEDLPSMKEERYGSTAVVKSFY